MLFNCVLTGTLHKLRKSMIKRRAKAFTPGTDKNRISQLKLYIGFCITHNLKDVDPSTETLCLYIEFLAQNLASPKSVANYMSSVRFLHRWLGIQSAALDSFEVTLMLRACRSTMHHIPLQRRPLTPDMIRQLICVSKSIVPHHIVFKCAVLFAFFGFLRMSNLTSRSQHSFDPAKHTCRGDVFRGPPGLIVLLKWSKTNQFGENTELIPLPQSDDPLLCPVIAFSELESLVPTYSSNQPLLSLPTPPGEPIRPVHPDWLSRMLQQSLAAMGEDPAFYSFHSFRRSGATTCYNAGVEYSQIQRHGSWKSSAFWAYITNWSTGHTPVTQALSKV